MYLVYKGEFPDGFCENSFDNLKDAKEFLLSLNDDSFCIIEIKKACQINNANENVKKEIESIVKELEKFIQEYPMYNDIVFEYAAPLNMYYKQNKNKKNIDIDFNFIKCELERILNDCKNGNIRNYNPNRCEAIRGVE